MIIIYVLRENIETEKEMEKERNLIVNIMVIYYYLKENIKVEKEMEKEKNMIQMAF